MNDSDKLKDPIYVVTQHGFLVASIDEVNNQIDQRICRPAPTKPRASRKAINWVRRLIRRAERHGRLS